MKKLYMLFLALLPLLTWGQVLSWNLTGAAGSEVSLPATSKDPNMSASSLSRGAGVTASALGNAFSASGWNVTTQALAISGNKYFQFTVNPASGFQVSLSTLDAYFRRSSTGPSTFQWQYSLDGFATAGVDIGSNITYSLTTGNGDVQAQIDLSGITALQNIPNGTTVTIRLFGWNASAAGGTFALGRPSTPSLIVGGTVTANSNSPAITAAPGSLTSFTTITGTPSTQQPITVNASNLTTDITITPGSPYEVSIDGGTNYSPNAVTLAAPGGTVTSATVNVRIAASASVGTANSSVTFAAAGAGTQTVTLAGNVTSGVTVDPPQTFNATGASVSTINLTGTGNVAGDNVLIAYNSSNTFGTPTGALSVGNNITGGGTVLYNGPSAGFNINQTSIEIVTDPETRCRH